MKLGKLPPRWDSRTLRLSKYIAEQLPVPPVACGWEFRSAFALGPMKNLDLGDCTIAAAGHMIQEWTSNSGKMFIPSDEQIIKAYGDITGYTPSDPSSDQGAVELDVLKYWHNTGIAGHKIGAFATLEPGNVDHIKAAVWLMGGVYIGVGLPVSCQDQPSWEVPPYGPTGDGEPGSWGGHAVPVVGYGRKGLTIITWGKTLTMSWEFWKTYVDESYAILSLDFLKNGKTPVGLNLTQLQADLSAL